MTVIRTQFVVPCLNAYGAPAKVQLEDVCEINPSSWAAEDSNALNEGEPSDFHDKVYAMHFLHAAWYSAFTKNLHWFDEGDIDVPGSGELEVNPSGNA